MILTLTLKVDAAPLAPACLLYLDAISWFDQRTGAYEAQVEGDVGEM